ncbi:MAG: SurA N-terminal domain-containing protein [Coxiella-like endosymbiont]|uniref:SurA N-terminal domain-containing protein n=1 Tax=Coxiella-like endosymbiont TaxID=1592897 RepID=UPI00215B051E|nr:SurA N-terminal domain-containing protein [Coxiella-like endosymbiont]UVE59385.1 SurA N-terminal domain-containing protein [Coxiella-like endosymbiont]
MLKKIVSFIVILFTIGYTFTQSALSTALTITPEQSLNQIVAVVNDEIITQSEFTHAASIAKQQFAQEHIALPNEQTFKRQVLDQLIYQALQLQLAKRSNIKVTNKEVNAAIAHIAAQNHFSRTILQRKLAQEGIAYKQFRDQLQEQLTISKLQHQIVGNDITIDESDISAFKKQHQKQLAPTQYHIATILIPLFDSSTQAQINHARGKAMLVLNKLRSGSNFETGMKMHPGSIDLGWRTADNLPQVFASAITKMKPNEIAGPIQAPNGFHIIKLIDKEATGNVTDQQVQQIVYQQKLEQAIQKWLLQLRRAAYIRIMQ